MHKLWFINVFICLFWFLRYSQVKPMWCRLVASRLLLVEGWFGAGQGGLLQRQPPQFPEALSEAAESQSWTPGYICPSRKSHASKRSDMRSSIVNHSAGYTDVRLCLFQPSSWKVQRMQQMLHQWPFISLHSVSGYFLFSILQVSWDRIGS